MQYLLLPFYATDQGEYVRTRKSIHDFCSGRGLYDVISTEYIYTPSSSSVNVSLPNNTQNTNLCFKVEHTVLNLPEVPGLEQIRILVGLVFVATGVAATVLVHSATPEIRIHMVF